MPAFFDSNVLLYVAQDDARKTAIVNELLSEGGWISVQVLNEMAHVARRKFRYDWPHVDTLLAPVQALLRVLDLTHDIHLAGLRWARRHQLSVYDGMIVAAALAAGCDTLYSEDMHDGLVVERTLMIVNPFAR